MATKCQLGARCGGHVAGWLQESHPQPQDGIVEKKVCLTFGVNCCKWNLKIKVRNCGSFNLYKLKAPVAFCSPNRYWRFCGNGQSGEQQQNSVQCASLYIVVKHCVYQDGLLCIYSRCIDRRFCTVKIITE